MIKKHKSTVLSVAWCVNNKFIVTGSADMKARIFSGYLEGIDSAEDDGFGEVWPKQHEFGEVLAEFDQARAWVHSVAWAPGGFRLAFTGHGSTVHFVQIFAGSAPVVQSINLPKLPFLDLRYVNDDVVIASGFDNNTAVFQTGGSDSDPVWAFNQWVDKGEEKKAAAGGSGFANVKDDLARRVNQGLNAAETSRILTKHKNIITNVQLLADANGRAVKFSTGALDGRLLIWDLTPLKLKL